MVPPDFKKTWISKHHHVKEIDFGSSVMLFVSMFFFQALEYPKKQSSKQNHDHDGILAPYNKTIIMLQHDTIILPCRIIYSDNDQIR